MVKITMSTVQSSMHLLLYKPIPESADLLSEVIHCLCKHAHGHLHLHIMSRANMPMLTYTYIT